MRIQVMIPVAAALLALTACSGDSSGPPTVAAPSAPPAATGGGGPAAAAPVDTSCSPRRSLRPTSALPQPGRMPPGSLMETIYRRGRLILGTSQDTLQFS